MKLSGRDANAYFRKPDPDAAGLLIYGEDTMRVAMKRAEVVLALIGPQGADEMRLTRVSAADLRRDKALLDDAVKAQSFFPGARVALVEEAGDTVAPQIAAALEDWRPGDAQIVVTAGSLPAKSSLRKLFETAKHAFAAALYNDPMGRDEIEAELKRAGLRDVGREAMTTLEALARTLTPGDFRQTLDKVALYKLDDDSALTPDEVALNAPATIEAQIDEVFHIVAEGRTGDLAPVMMRLDGQGVAPVTLLILAMRHFRVLYALCSAPGGPANAVQKLRPPIFGPRRDRLLRQAGRWNADAVEMALTQLMDTDLTLRSAGQRAPAMALVERCFIRVAHYGARL
ncbi:DNA polymerase III subunit delta [Thalassococcus sp. CAU 1522]|uniref:DNA polymerase III subunit delta n=1 Tax=Thalassococcus arenae TaxID=2851652 RepID=A0ABS6N4C8_9RHOB|nr:DNA polymerase III subunit delta [Thalassococcus arenae]MBV2358872.1 DNA polymerase III subunit delta [Thalassococcus arenae]